MPWPSGVLTLTGGDPETMTPSREGTGRLPSTSSSDSVPSRLIFAVLVVPLRRPSSSHAPLVRGVAVDGLSLFWFVAAGGASAGASPDGVGASLLHPPAVATSSAE